MASFGILALMMARMCCELTHRLGMPDLLAFGHTLSVRVIRLFSVLWYLFDKTMTEVIVDRCACGKPTNIQPMSLRQITEPVEIKTTMRSFMLEPDKQRASFIVAIHQKPGENWNGWTVTPGGHVIEGAKVVSCATSQPENDPLFTLGDQQGQVIGAVRLSGITKLEVLR